jgi:hypothetical protein
MSNITIPSKFGAVSSVFRQANIENDLAAGVVSGFGIISYRGKVWRTKYRGEERDLMREDGDGPRASIEVVILKGTSHLSKIYYENGYVEGSTAQPDCWSSNGVTPDAAATKKQHSACATCKQNAFGSRITPAGKQGKACSDSKRLAIVPLEDLDNEVYGGPMLLRVPAASLGDLATFGTKMQALGYPYNSIGVRISFDTKEAYPKFVFSAIRPLTDEEAQKVLGYQTDPRVSRILNESSDYANAPAEAPAQAFEQVFEQPPAPKAAPAPAPHDPVTGEVTEAPAPKTAPKKAAAKPAPKPEPAPVQAAVPHSFDDELDAALDELI